MWSARGVLACWLPEPGTGMAQMAGARGSGGTLAGQLARYGTGMGKGGLGPVASGPTCQAT